ncbi:MAG: recombinase zinc beta ribbon domain-containing protein [Thermofilaceae archaeon]
MVKVEKKIRVHKDGKVVEAKALFDTGSRGSYFSKEFAERIEYEPYEEPKAILLAERKINQDKWQKKDFLLRGLVYCQSCRRRLTAEVHPRGEYYRCQNGINSKYSEPYISIKSLENQVEKL